MSKTCCSVTRAVVSYSTCGQPSVSPQGRRVPGLRLDDAAGRRLAVLYLKLYQRLDAPLTAAAREPVPADHEVRNNRRSVLDRLYVAVDQALDRLATHLGLAA
jgi:hypothetical protein